MLIAKPIQFWVRKEKTGKEMKTMRTCLNSWGFLNFRTVRFSFFFLFQDGFREYSNSKVRAVI